jgi:hypothetical protein
MTRPGILLVSMPWQRADAPSLQLGLLKADLANRGFRVSALHAGPLLARRLGAGLYWKVANNLHPLLGEAFFAALRRSDFPHALFAEAVDATEELTEREFRKVVKATADFRDEWRERPPWPDWTSVGFSCTFNQLQASLWAAAEARRHGCRTVFGGFLTNGRLGRDLTKHPDVDAVLAGPGENFLAEWLDEPNRRRPPEAHTTLPAVIPDYDEFFAGLTEREKRSSCLLTEASRGCEYGACSFCAQNSRPGRLGHSLEFLERCLSELRRRYPPSKLEFADTSFPRSLLREESLARILGRFEVFAECRALKIGEMKAMAEAGFKNLQIGLESLHTEVLKRMRKGVSMLENVFCLKEAAENGVVLGYNIILDMPGTTAKELREMAALLPLLHHLPPPTTLVPFQLQYGSPAFRAPKNFGLKNIRPHPYHDLLSPDHPPFYFAFEPAETPASLTEVHEAFMVWGAAYDAKRPLLTVCFAGDSATVRDLRPGGWAGQEPYRLGKGPASALWACRTIQPRRALEEILGRDFSAAIQELKERKLLLDEKDFFLGLPVVLERGWPRPRLPQRVPVDTYFSESND